MGFKCLLLLLLWPAALHAATWSTELSLGFPDSPALRVSRRLNERLVVFTQTAAPFVLLVKSELPRKTLSRRESVAIQNEPQDLAFRLRMTSMNVTGMEWLPFQGRWFLQSAYERRQLSIASDVRTPFRFITAVDSQLSRSEIEARVHTRSYQDLLRFATGQRFHWGEGLTFGWYCGWTEVLRTQSLVQARVGLRNREATLSREADAENLQDALEVQSANLQSLAAKALQDMTAQRIPLLGLSLGFHF